MAVLGNPEGTTLAFSLNPAWGFPGSAGACRAPLLLQEACLASLGWLTRERWPVGLGSQKHSRSWTEDAAWCGVGEQWSECQVWPAPQGVRCCLSGCVLGAGRSRDHPEPTLCLASLRRVKDERRSPASREELHAQPWVCLQSLLGSLNLQSPPQLPVTPEREAGQGASLPLL